MKFFGRSRITIRCAFRGNALAVPSVERVLSDCPEAQLNRLRRRLSRIAASDQRWSLTWDRQAGDDLRPHDRVAVLRLRNIVVELVYAQHCRLAEIFVAQGAVVTAGDRLAAIRKRGEQAREPDGGPQADDTMLKLMARHRDDREQIQKLVVELHQNQRVVAQLRRELALLLGQRGAPDRHGPSAFSSTDQKFRQLKHEFSKHFHPDSRPGDDRERKSRERVFQEFWPIVEKIERS